MKVLVLGVMILGSISSFAKDCSRTELFEAINNYETQLNPYSNGNYEHTIQELYFNSKKEDQYIHEAVIGYEYSEGGYRLLEIKAESVQGVCRTEIEIVDEN